eukprot:3309699-Amphidinium_carterae.1
MEALWLEARDAFNEVLISSSSSSPGLMVLGASEASSARSSTQEGRSPSKNTRPHNAVSSSLLF